jgi:hypothetical protein
MTLRKLLIVLVALMSAGANSPGQAEDFTVGPSFPFPSRKADRPAGAFWYVSNDHGSHARDFILLRYDTERDKWTSRAFGVDPVEPPETLANEEHLAYGIAVRANVAGEVLTCWRNAPDNPPEHAHWGRDGCDNRCDYYAHCACIIPRVGNHVQLLLPDGRVVMYAHFAPGSVPTDLCPHNGTYVTDAEPHSGPGGHNPDTYVPPALRMPVQVGTRIGNIGHSGASARPHLHIHLKASDSAHAPSHALRFTDGWWQQQTPAMAAGLTNRVWSLREVLMCRVPPWPQPQAG